MSRLNKNSSRNPDNWRDQTDPLLQSSIISSSATIAKEYAIIILAAGASKRLGSSKQLLRYNNQSLVRHAVMTALQSPARPVIIVLGSRHDTVEQELAGLTVSIVLNEAWNEGIASSIRCGLYYLSANFPTIDAVIYMVCDQPYVTTALLTDLMAAQKKTGQPIIASDYGNTIGTPALFHKKFFADLLALKGDSGAKQIIRQNTGQLVTVSFPLGSIDIDTPADYDDLLNKGL